MKDRFWPAAMRLAPTLSEQAVAGPPRRHYVLLINPFYPKDPHASFGKHVLTPSLALTSIAAATPADWEVHYFDENLLHGPPPLDPLPQVVGITVHLTFAARAYAIARYYRSRGVKVVLGGLHVLSCPQECAPHADALAVGEGVEVWPQILRDLDAESGAEPARSGLALLHKRTGESPREYILGTPVYRGDFRRPYREDPVPRRDLLPRQSFLTTTSLIATRGCHNRCGFCYLSTEGLKMPYRMRDPEQVAAEFAADGQPYGVFVDNNLGSNREYLDKLCDALRPLQKIWSAAVTIDVTDDPKLIRQMARAGCTGVFIGFESLTDDNLTEARKRTPAAADYARRVRILHDNGIQVNGSFVLGFDHDGPEVFSRTADWIEENRLECATFHILTPYPGTPLFKSMEAEERLLHKDWSQYDTAHVVFRPRRMTVEQLADGYAYCYERLFSHQSIWKRRPEDPKAVPAYLAMSYLYKRANFLWHLLIQHDLVHTVWTPLVELSRRWHVQYRNELSHRPLSAPPGESGGLRPSSAGSVVYAGV
jgi:radical SAM superfamily enzyme YgiQ (UPF0313 family)